MPLKPTTVRFAEDSMELVQKAADMVGCRVGQFCREAAIMRAVALLGDQEPMADLDPSERAQEIRRLARRSDP